jgi:hypothetical protein
MSRQTSMKFGNPRPTRKAKAADHDNRNVDSAREILANPDKFGGEGSGLVNWAHAVMKRNGSAACPTW